MIDKFLNQIKTTLTNHNVDFEKVIDDLGQARAHKARLNGEKFNLNDHIKGLIYSQLSNQRSWGQIAEKLQSIDEIFSHYDAEILKNEDPNSLETQIKNIKCGNRRITFQMKYLQYNIEQFECIIDEFGSMDSYVTSKEPEEIAYEFSSGQRFKLKEVGNALAMEYLKNVGIEAVKPDVHICRIIGPERFGLIKDLPSQNEARQKKVSQYLMKLKNESTENAIYIDNLLWIFAAKNYGNICAAKPKCYECEVTLCIKNPKNSS